MAYLNVPAVAKSTETAARIEATNSLLSRVRPQVDALWKEVKSNATALPTCTLFFSITTGHERAHMTRLSANDLDEAWHEGIKEMQAWSAKQSLEPRWLRIDVVEQMHATHWQALQALLRTVKRNYFRSGIAFDAELTVTMLEQEIGANALLYDNEVEHAVPNAATLKTFSKHRFGRELAWPSRPDEPIWLFSTRAVFTDGNEVHVLEHQGRNAGYRMLPHWGASSVRAAIDSSTSYLARQVQPSGAYRYGWFPCFDRPIPTYNALRHASSTYALLEGWELTRRPEEREAIDRALAYLASDAIREVKLSSGEPAAFLVDLGDEIKLGGNAVCLLAFVKYTELTSDTRYVPLLERLARGILHMQNPATGQFVHVLAYPDLRVVQENRTIYYDGEAAFGLMRLYGLTKHPSYLAAVEKAFDHFIEAKHWQAHDHWLSYCVNELTLYKGDERYYRFGLDNVRGHLDFVLERITTFPTLLELMMAAQKMIVRLQDDPANVHLLQGFDLDKFHRALEFRARYLLNGHFWPELAMFFKNPARIVGSFFIRHHSYRVRIDDVEHYLSGYVAYLKYLEGSPRLERKGPVVLWGGDVNLGRRQHYMAARLGMQRVLAPVRAIAQADLSIVNLECVVATGGKRCIPKGEGGPYYFRARPEMLEVLTAAGVDMVTTANNHSGDYGPDALREQLRWLRATGLAQAGSGNNLEAALTPAVLPAGPYNVAVFSLDATQPRFAASVDTPGSAHLSLDDPAQWTACLAPRIAQARVRAQVVLVAVHWGENRATRPDAGQSAVGRALIDAGADAVLGASAHVLHGVELHRGRPIIHDAGDLLFDARRSDGGEGGVFELELGAHGVDRLVFVPVNVGFGQSIQLEGAPAMAAAQRYAARCAELGVQLECRADGTAAIDLTPAPREQSRLPAQLQTKKAAPVHYDLRAIQRPRPVPVSCTRAEVPLEAALSEPLRIGPLTLLGVVARPQEAITSRRNIWIETFWRCDEPVTRDHRIDLRAKPLDNSPMPPWGFGMDHDPCDWLMPTSQWQPGTIYRDYCPLRPPEQKDLVNGRLQLEVALVLRRERQHVHALDVFFGLAVPGKDAKPEADAPPEYRTEFDVELLTSTDDQTWNAAQLAAITGGTWTVEPPPGWSVRSVVSGAKHIPMRDAPVLYVAHDTLDRTRHEQSTVTGQYNVDRHRLLPELAPSLAGAIVKKPVKGLPPNFPLLQVHDPIQAIMELGFAARARYAGEVIAVTGTVGKSTTLGLLTQALGGSQRVLCSVDNYNSRVGAPSTLASLSPAHEAAVVEVAQSALWMKRGPITRLLRPTIALVTAIGFSQTNSMVKSIDDVVRWKSRVFDGLSGQATAVVGEHLVHFDRVLQEARKHAKRCIVFGRSEAADIRLLSVRGNAYGSWVEVETPSGTVGFYVPLPGEGMVNNALSVVAVLHAMGHDLESGMARIAGFEPEEGRLQWHTLSWDGVRTEVLDDSWNAEVESMRNAFSVLAIDKRRRHGRKVAVLGRIVHLGDMARPLHESLADPLVASGAELVLTHGDEMQYLRAVMPSDLLGPHFASADDLARYLRRELRDGDTVLLKGSRRNSDFGETFPKLRALSGSSPGTGRSSWTQ